MGVKKLSFENFDVSNLFESYWRFFTSDLDAKTKYYSISTLDFVKFVSMKSPKSRGVDIEKRIAAQNGWSIRKKSGEDGDLTDLNGSKVEVKSTLITPLKEPATLRGFRTWEKVSYYLIVILDIRNFSNKIDIHFFNIPPGEITTANGYTTYSQSKKSITDATKLPLGIDFEIGDATFLRWNSEFRVEDIRL